jgi:dihydrodipicolinate synthase/N-acetylneuraminate lyase
MLPKTVLRLANDFQNIVAVKEAAGIWFKLCK